MTIVGILAGNGFGEPGALATGVNHSRLALLRSLTSSFKVTVRRYEDLTPQPPLLQGEGGQEATPAVCISPLVWLPPLLAGEVGWGGEVFAALAPIFETTVTLPARLIPSHALSTGARGTGFALDRLNQSSGSDVQ